MSRLLYERYPDEDEGFLTARRAALVNRNALAALALELGLDRHLQLGRGEAEAGGRDPTVAPGGDHGGVCRCHLPQRGHRHHSRPAPRPLLGAHGRAGGGVGAAEVREEPAPGMDAALPRTRKPFYALLTTVGPPHDQTFTVAAVVDGRQLAVGEGSSRQRAEEQAAELALEILASATPDVPPDGEQVGS